VFGGDVVEGRRRQVERNEVQIGVRRLDEPELRADVMHHAEDRLLHYGLEGAGAADEDLTSSRIAEQEAELELLMKRRDELSRRRP
jgi:hypothetical protein